MLLLVKATAAAAAQTKLVNGKGETRNTTVK